MRIELPPGYEIVAADDDCIRVYRNGDELTGGMKVLSARYVPPTTQVRTVRTSLGKICYTLALGLIAFHLGGLWGIFALGLGLRILELIRKNIEDEITRRKQLV